MMALLPGRAVPPGRRTGHRAYHLPRRVGVGAVCPCRAGPVPAGQALVALSWYKFCVSITAWRLGFKALNSALRKHGCFEDPTQPSGTNTDAFLHRPTDKGLSHPTSCYMLGLEERKSQLSACGGPTRLVPALGHQIWDDDISLLLCQRHRGDHVCTAGTLPTVAPVWRRELLAELLVSVWDAGLVVSDGRRGGTCWAARLREEPVPKRLLTPVSRLGLPPSELALWARGAARGTAAGRGSRSQWEFPSHFTRNDDL